MKKLLLASFALAAFSANAQTVKKVIIEDYTGLHCGWCPEGTVVLEGLRASNPTNCIPVAIHTGGYEPSTSSINMQSTVGGTLTSTLKVLGYPNGSVDRKRYAPLGFGGDTIAMGRGSWSAAFNAQKAKTAIASVSFSNLVDKGSNNYECDINVSFSTLPTAGVPIVVQLFVLEDSIAATGPLAQDNYSTNVQGGKSPLSPWFHNRTLRMSASGDAWGFTGVVPGTPVVGTKYTKKVAFTANSAWVKKNVTLVAYVAMNGSAVNDQKEILNAEETRLSAFYKTGISNTENVVNINSAYPNPASVNDVIKVEYNTPENGNVTLKVYNAMGQVVATPVVSYEIAGTHTMQWRAAEYNLAAGNYFLEVSTANGKQIQKITLQ